MAITKEKKISYISVVGDFKRLQIIGSEIIKENNNVIAEKEIAFFISPDEVFSDRKESQELPELEKAKINELIELLWTDKLKTEYKTFKEAKVTKFT